MFKNLRNYLSYLESNGELCRITEPVSSELEIAEITDRVSSQPDGGKALWFENTDKGFSVVTNMMGSDKRIAMALGVSEVSDFTKRLDSLLGGAMSPKHTLMDKLRLLPLLSDAARWMPKKTKRKGECQQVIIRDKDVDLSILPVLKCAPFDAAPFITLPLVHTIDPENGGRNIGMYRMQIMGKNITGMHWHKHKTGARHYEAYKKLGKRMPVSVVLGGDPAYTYSATAPLPDGIDEYILSGFLRNKSVELVKCITNDNYVPRDADFVIEGYVDTEEEKVIEGPFADHTGFYSLEDKYPVFHVTCITHRRDAIYPATLVGIPPKEDAYIAKATEKIFVSPIKAVLQPEVRDMWLPEEGVAHNLALIDIHKTYAGQGVKSATMMLGAAQMMFVKCVVVTQGKAGKLSSDETLHDIFNRLHVSRDVTILTGVMDVLDHTSNEIGVGGKIIIDATNEPVLSECSVPETFSLNADIVGVNAALTAKGLPLVFVNMTHECADFRAAMSQFYADNNMKGVKIMVAYDEAVCLSDLAMLMWLAGGNVDAKRDTEISGSTLLIDARAKFGGVNGFPREWPNVIAMSDDIIKLVDTKWSKLGLGEFIPSPTHKYKPLLFKGKAAVEQ